MRWSPGDWGAAVVDPLTVALAIASGVLLVRFRVNSAWLVLAGVLVGLLALALGLKWR
jgi:chromate transporter